LEEEKTTLEGMVESHDELLLEIAREIGLDRMGEDEEDTDDGGDAATPPPTTLPPPVPPAVVPEEIDEEGPVEVIREQEAPMSHLVVPADAELVIPQLAIYHALMRDYEENPLRLEDRFDDLDDDQSEDRSNVDKWFPDDGNNDRD
jgi:hypothetical protein